MCSSTIKPLMLQSATDKTSEGKVMFTKATSVPRGPSSTLKRRCSGMVSVGARTPSMVFQIHDKKKRRPKKQGELTVSNLWRLRHQRCGDGKQDFVSGVPASPLFSPEQLQHGLDRIRSEVIIIPNVTLKKMHISSAKSSMCCQNLGLICI